MKRLRRPGRGAARRPAGRAARQGRDQPRRDGPADDRPRPEVDLHAAGDGAPGEAALSVEGAADGGLSRAGRRPRRPPRRDPRPRRPGRRRAAPSSRGRSSASTATAAAPSGSTARRSPSPRRATPSPRGSILVPEDRKASRHPPRPPDRREHRPAAPRRPRRARLIVSRDRERPLAEDAAAAPRHQARPMSTRARARCPAATSRRWCWPSGCRCSPKAIDLRRADARHRRRRQERDLRRCAALADAGVAILMISSDMEEVIGVSDRIAVMHEGAISGMLERTNSASTTCCSWPSAQPAARAVEMERAMNKKDLGLLVLILVVGAVVAIINPRFLSPINLANTANLIGLFGIFAIGAGLRHHHRRHRAFGRLDGRAARRAVRRPDRQPRRALAARASLLMLRARRGASGSPMAC